MQFCPHDGTLLHVNVDFGGTAAQEVRFACPVCPYIHVPRRKRASVVPTTKKRIDDVMGGAESWSNVDTTEAQCPACNHREAFFMQIQIRCVACHHRWSD
ncbi:hypothetical protein CTAYLR_004491 [Chrysophaeum taylorii]|uniref:TFIIS-type domain-containing protein n=1 Tax=Chrysophaeum taylorii TaxID=2483200 RepID=A0AAD7UB08_9STRA|nr:hypothetical protein CTAYLR_004491 [Chrysophaeum taylorii]